MVTVFFRKKIDGQKMVDFDKANGAFFQDEFLILTDNSPSSTVQNKVGQFYAEDVSGFFVEEEED